LASINTTGKKIKEQKIKATIELNDSGLLVFKEVYIETEGFKEKSIGGKIADTVMSFFGGGENQTESSELKNDTVSELFIDFRSLRLLIAPILKKKKPASVSLPLFKPTLR
jgi:hypothetical protein